MQNRDIFEIIDAYTACIEDCFVRFQCRQKGYGIVLQIWEDMEKRRAALITEAIERSKRS